MLITSRRVRRVKLQFTLKSKCEKTIQVLSAPSLNPIY